MHSFCVYLQTQEGEVFVMDVPAVNAIFDGTYLYKKKVLNNV